MKDYTREESMPLYGENRARIVNVSDEVVKNLEERKSLHGKLIGYESENGTITNIMPIDVLNDAIEITKQSGVSES